MSTPFYDLASLVVVPSGYKSGKIYAQKPLTTDGQLTFTRASNATRVNASGLIETVSSGVPRLDYTNSSCPKILLEPQRSNALTNSQDFSTGYFSTDVTVTTNTTASPDGTTNADTITEGTANDLHRVGQNFSATSGATYTASIFCKAGNGTRNLGILFGCGFGEQEVVFNVNNGTIVASSGATGTITNYGNGWYRCTATATSASTVNACVQYQLRNGTNQSYLGNGTSTLIYWGAQVEAGAYATSYIPTTSAAVTRLADDAFKASVGSWFTNGFTLYADVIRTEDTGPVRVIMAKGAGGTYNNFIDIEYYQSNKLLAVVTDNSAVTHVFIVDSTAYSPGQRIKIAFRCKAGEYALYVNGVIKGSASYSLLPTVTDFRLSYSDYYGKNLVNTAMVLPALTADQMAELTTL